jgi:hypothetical protein
MEYLTGEFPLLLFGAAFDDFSVVSGCSDSVDKVLFLRVSR